MPIQRTVNTDFFKHWSSEMAYVLGFFYADGNLIKTKRSTHFLAFYSSDKELLQQFRDVLNSNHKISRRAPKTGTVYRLQIGSKEMFYDLVELGCTQCKTLTMEVPRIPQAYVKDFLRGYFDGDGNVWIGDVHKNREKSSPVLQLSFTSGSKEFLLGIKEVLRSFGILGGGLYTPTHKNFTRLTLSTRDALKLAEIMYNGQPKLYLERKKLRFEQFKKLRA